MQYVLLYFSNLIINVFEKMRLIEVTYILYNISEQFYSITTETEIREQIELTL